jgi:hypothetical protein
LTTGQSYAAFTDKSVQALGQGCDEISELRRLDRGRYRRMIDRGSRYPERDIGSYRGIGEEDVLWHVTDAHLPTTDVVSLQVNTVDNNAAGPRVEQSEYDVYACGLARAGLAGYSDRGPCAYRQRQPREDWRRVYSMAVVDISQLERAC